MGSARAQDRRSVNSPKNNLFYYNNLSFQIPQSAGASERRTGQAQERQVEKVEKTSGKRGSGWSSADARRHTMTMIGRTSIVMTIGMNQTAKDDRAGALSRDSTLGDGPGRKPGQPLTKAPRKDPFPRVVACGCRSCLPARACPCGVCQCTIGYRAEIIDNRITLCLSLNCKSGYPKRSACLLPVIQKKSPVAGKLSGDYFCLCDY